MIKEVQEKDIIECVNVIRESFKTVADELGFTVENAPGFTAFSTTEEKIKKQLLEELLKHAFNVALKMGTQKYDFFPFTCGYMEKKLGE